MEKRPKADLVKETDEDLVRYFLNSKDDRAISLLYDRYSKPLFGKCFAITGQREVARDLTHDIFIKIFLNLSQFKEISKFWFWAHRIAYNHCMTYLRKRNRLHFSELDDMSVVEIANNTDDLDDKILLEARIELIEQGFLQLNETERIVLSMKYQSDFSVRQIAETLELQEGAVKMRLKRGRDKLSEIIDNLSTAEAL